MSIERKYRHVIRELVSRLEPTDVTWALTGSLAHRLQGVPVDVRDVDVQTDQAGAYSIERVFRDHMVQAVGLLSAARVRSHFGRLAIGAATVEIMGALQKRLQDGSWEPPVDVSAHRVWVTLGRIRVPVLSLRYEAGAYEVLGRKDRAALLRLYSDVGPGVEIRLAVAQDAEAISDVLREAFGEYEALYTGAAFEATVLSAEAVLERMREGPVWVVVVGGKIVGTGSGVVRGEGFYLRGMAVGPEARGRRLGWLLLEEMEAFARDRGLKRMYLSTTPFLYAAIRLYERYGFRRSDKGPYEMSGTPLFTMAMPLWTEEPQ